MRRTKGFGVGRQGFHPRARGGLSPESGSSSAYNGISSAEITENFFVPSFSIRRHLHSSEEQRWTGVRRRLSGTLGRYFTAMHPATMAIKSIEQKALIEKIRESGNQPTSTEMRNVVFNIRDELTEALAASPDPLEVGLGRLAIFGKGHNKVGFTIDGWHGWRARYAMTDQYGEMTTHGALLTENNIALGSIATALADTPFAVNEIASNPHLTIATAHDRIRDHELRRMQAEVNEMGLDRVLVGDPIIDFKAGAHVPTETLHVRHSWNTLAVTA